MNNLNKECAFCKYHHDSKVNLDIITWILFKDNLLYCSWTCFIMDRQ